MKCTNFLYASLLFFNGVIIGADQSVTTAPVAGAETLSLVSGAEVKDASKLPQKEPMIFNWRGPVSYGPLGQEPHLRGKEAKVKDDSVGQQNHQYETGNNIAEQARPIVGSMVQGRSGPIFYLPSLQKEGQEGDSSRYDDDSRSDSRSDADDYGWRRRRDVDDDHAGYGHRWSAGDDSDHRDLRRGFNGGWRGRGQAMGMCACDCMCCRTGHFDGGKFKGMMSHDGATDDYGPRKRFNGKDDDRQSGVTFVDHAPQGLVFHTAEAVSVSVTPAPPSVATQVPK